MGLFDHLFKTKSPPGEEKVVEHAAEAGAPKPVEGAPRTPTPQRADPSAFLHPKNFVPRGAPSLTPAPRPGSGISGKGGERRPIPGGPTPAGDEIVLTLGDVLSRIPTHYLKPGTHDAKRELRFKINDLSSDIARGRAAVPLSRIAQLLPEIFVKEISADEDTEVRLPLQKLVEQIGLLRSMPKTAPVEKMARSVTPIELPPGIKSVLPLEAKKEAPTARPAMPSPMMEPLRPAAEQPLPPPIILAEPASTPKTVELKPAAEQTPVPPVILGPPPMVEPPAPAEAPVPAAAAAAPVLPVTPVELVPAAPVLVPEIPEVKQVAEPIQPPPTPEPIPPVATAPPAAAMVAPEPQKIVLDWGPHVPAKVEESKETSAPAAVIEPPPVIEPARVEPAAEVQKLAPVESPELETGEEKIQLSLAAILRQCPPEIIVGQLPHVDDSVRITLPFAPIDRQLVKGHVEVSALRFIVALPEIYQKYFVAKVGVKVPIPLEEVFQNLPTPKHELTVDPAVTPPVFLTFAADPAPAPAAAPIISEPEKKSEEQPVAVPSASEVKPVEVPLPPVESPKVEAPASPVAADEVPAAAPVVPPLEAAPTFSIVPPVETTPLPSVPLAADLPGPLTAEKAVPPPLPVAAETTPSVSAPPPLPSVAMPSNPEPLPTLPPELVPPWWSASPAFLAANGRPPTELRPSPPPAAASEIPPGPVSTPEVQSVAPPVEFTPPPLPIPPVAPNEPAAAEETPKPVFNPPVFRPHFIPPPPIFGFASPAVVKEPEPVVKPEPPSVLPGLMENLQASPTVEVSTAAAPVPEAVAPETVAIAAVTSAPSAPVEPPPLPGAEAPQTPLAEAPVETRPDSEPSSELIASAGEHSAPDIAHFSDEPVPYADLAESLAHETTYAPALAEVVNVERPAAESTEPKPPVAAEVTTAAPPAAEKPPEAEEQHRAVPIVEGLAAAAVAATIAEHVPLHFHEVVAPAEEPKAPEEPVAHAEAPAAVEIPAVVETPAEIEHKAEEPAVAAETIVAEKPAEPVAEPMAEAAVMEAAVAPVESALPVETPAAEPPTVPTPEPPVAETPEPEPPAAAVPPPPPQPPFALPKIPSEPVRLEVLPPPALPVRRFDQDAVQALFMTEEALDLPQVSRLAAALPGVYACVIATRDQACTGGTLPDGFDLAALLGLAPRVGEAAGRMPIGQLKHFTLYGDAYSVSFFERNGLSLCAVHRPRSFVPGVREKLVALADELSR
ncbi:MAG: hypothetical protein P4L99_05375 [Chthoniobacter sp.]|nr:hypothetical protein [Chthoniobacter sp.]